LHKDEAADREAADREGADADEPWMAKKTGEPWMASTF
jgi:hypothetical protein